MGPDGSGGRCTRGGEIARAVEWKPVTYVATGAARVRGGRFHWQRKKGGGREREGGREAQKRLSSSFPKWGEFV